MRAMMGKTTSSSCDKHRRVTTVSGRRITQKSHRMPAMHWEHGNADTVPCTTRGKCSMLTVPQPRAMQSQTQLPTSGNSAGCDDTDSRTVASVRSVLYAARPSSSPSAASCRRNQQKSSFPKQETRTAHSCQLEVHSVQNCRQHGGHEAATGTPENTRELLHEYRPSARYCRQTSHTARA